MQSIFAIWQEIMLYKLPQEVKDAVFVIDKNTKVACLSSEKPLVRVQTNDIIEFINLLRENCVYDIIIGILKENNKNIDVYNIIRFVLLHELGHLYYRRTLIDHDKVFSQQLNILFNYGKNLYTTKKGIEEFYRTLSIESICDAFALDFLR